MKNQIKKTTVRPLLILVTLAMVLWGGQTAWAAKLATYRAIYSLELLTAEPQSNITNAYGFAKSEFIDSCEGWISNDDLFLNLRNSEGDVEVFATTASTTENKQGSFYRFKTAQILGSVEDLPSFLEGHAIKDGNSAAAYIESPEREKIPLDRTVVFPAQFMQQVIDAALNNQRFLSRQLFDGSDADGGFLVSAVIGKRHPPDDKQSEALLRTAWWPVSLAFYSLATPSEAPTFVVEFEMLENGIAQNRTMNFGDYVVKAEITKIEALPPTQSRCPR